MKLNKEWHLQHPMPKNATLDERIAWHIEYAKHCMCREMPDKIKEEKEKNNFCMKYLFSFLLFVHGLIHLMGFANGFGFSLYQ